MNINSGIIPRANEFDLRSSLGERTKLNLQISKYWSALFRNVLFLKMVLQFALGYFLFNLSDYGQHDTISESILNKISCLKQSKN